MREVRLHDTLSGELRPLEPREPPRVGIYTCGPTVYGRIHIGNARPYVLFALLKRFLEHEGYEVTLVENITDVNDKIYAAAREAGRPSEELAREMTAHYVADTDRLGLGRPDHEPLATATIAEIVALISALIERGHAYEAEGDVYFSVGSLPSYGRLSNRPPDQLEQGEGDDAARLKRAPADFALWKAAKPDEDSSWPAPWGEGRPGWHIECSAMAESLLGLAFEIHGGGSDLIFPHHENELAQTEAARGEPLARLWVHNGMVRMEEEKMAKSVGNVAPLHAVLDDRGHHTVVAYLASGHYRQPLSYSTAALDDSARSVARIRELCRRLDRGADGPRELGEPYERFLAALAEDFNTPAARAALFDWVAGANRRLDAGERFGPGELAVMLWLLGLEELLEEGDAPPDERARTLLAERESARAERDFERADAARDELAALGWEVRDTAEGPQLVPRG